MTTAIASIGLALLYVVAIVGLIIGWDEVVDVVKSITRSSSKRRGDPERTVQLRVHQSRAAARARVAPVPPRRGRRRREPRSSARHRRE